MTNTEIRKHRLTWRFQRLLLDDCVTDGVTYFDLWLLCTTVYLLAYGLGVALNHLQSLWYRVCWMVRRDEPLRDGVISPISAWNTCCRGGTSTVGSSDFGPRGSGNFLMYRSFRDSLCTRTPRTSWVEGGGVGGGGVGDGVPTPVRQCRVGQYSVMCGSTFSLHFSCCPSLEEYCVTDFSECNEKSPVTTPACI